MGFDRALNEHVLPRGAMYPSERYMLNIGHVMTWPIINNVMTMFLPDMKQRHDIARCEFRELAL